MCYDIQTNLEAQLTRAKRLNDAAAIAEITEKLRPYTQNYYHVSGFAHPEVAIYTSQSPAVPSMAKWGLVPDWIKGPSEFNSIWNNTLNARAETIFEKAAYKKSAQGFRCIIPAQAFYEHHHKNGKSYPYRVFKKDGSVMHIAGIWNQWEDQYNGKLLATFSVVTTKANELLAEIHNNPKMNEARIPLILNEEQEDFWLDTEHCTEETYEDLLEGIKSDALDAYSVAPIRGKNASPNEESAIKKKYYPALEEEQGSLF